MKKYTITEKEYLEMVDAMNTLSGENQKLRGFIDGMREQLLINGVVQAKPEKVCELIRQKFDDWVFGLETQAGEKLKVVDSSDFNEIITEIESELKDL